MQPSTHCRHWTHAELEEDEQFSFKPYRGSPTFVVVVIDIYDGYVELTGRATRTLFGRPYPLNKLTRDRLGNQKFTLDQIPDMPFVLVRTVKAFMEQVRVLDEMFEEQRTRPLDTSQ